MNFAGVKKVSELETKALFTLDANTRTIWCSDAMLHELIQALWRSFHTGQEVRRTAFTCRYHEVAQCVSMRMQQCEIKANQSAGVLGLTHKGPVLVQTFIQSSVRLGGSVITTACSDTRPLWRRLQSADVVLYITDPARTRTLLGKNKHFAVHPLPRGHVYSPGENLQYTPRAYFVSCGIP